ncbi:MAG: hypothetical protein RLZZ161_743 [Bacteroidota bacterium]|jgi:hypothetical protein
MTKKQIIEKTIQAINKLPTDKALEISDFAEFVSKKYENYILTEGVQHLVSESQAFDFLSDEEDIYTEKDIKQKYSG